MNSPLWQLFLARVRSFYREPSVLFWAFGFPLVLTLALGIAFRDRPPEPSAVGVAADCEASVREALAADSGIALRTLAAEEEERALRTGAVALVVRCVPERSYHFDAARPDARLARLVVHDVLERAAGRGDVTTPSERHVTEVGARYIDFLVPGLIGSNLMSSGLWGLGYALVEMRVQRLLKRLGATPMRRSQFLLSFLLLRAMFAAIELPVMLLFAWLVFGVVVQGSVVLLFAIALYGSLVFGGIGVLVASRAENTTTVSGLINLVSLPMYLCSGVFFSPERFPDALKPIVRALPLTALIDALRGVMNEGDGLVAVAPRLGICAAWGGVAFFVALKGFRWR